MGCRRLGVVVLVACASIAFVLQQRSTIIPSVTALSFIARRRLHCGGRALSSGDTHAHNHICNSKKKSPRHHPRNKRSTTLLHLDKTSGNGEQNNQRRRANETTAFSQEQFSSPEYNSVSVVSDVDQERQQQQQQQKQPKAAKFGDVVDLRNRPRSTTTDEALFANDDDSNAALPTIQSLGGGEDNDAASGDDETSIIGTPEEQKRRNGIVAVAAVLLAVLNYAWQWFHPVTGLELLATMQERSAPITVVGSNNGKPTVVDFWAPWCENCKLSAPTLAAVEAEYQDKVNFVMVNGDLLTENWDSIAAFRVDAVPHLALVDPSGRVETALIGAVPKHVLEADLDTMIRNADADAASSTRQGEKEPPQALPYTMLDVFAGRPEEERQVHF